MSYSQNVSTCFSQIVTNFSRIFVPDAHVSAFPPVHCAPLYNTSGLYAQYAQRPDVFRELYSDKVFAGFGVEEMDGVWVEGKGQILAGSERAFKVAGELQRGNDHHNVPAVHSGVDVD